MKILGTLSNLKFIIDAVEKFNAATRISHENKENDNLIIKL